MTHELLLANISRHIQLDEKEARFFLSLLIEKEVPRKSLMLREGQACNYLSFVAAGALRAYHVDKDGKEATIMFAAPDWWVTDMFCFLNNKPAMMYIEAIDLSSIYQLSKQNWEKLLHQVPKFEKFFRILMQNAYTREQIRIIENLSLTAEARYDSFLHKYPHIARMVTQKQIASYLGITPEFLSFIRKGKAAKKIS